MRAYAQPVFTGNQFIPTERDHDREVLSQIQKAQYHLRRSHIRMAAKKILFDIPTEHGTARPDFLIALLNDETGEELKFALQVLQSQDQRYLELRGIERERLKELGPVISMHVEEITADALSHRARSLLE